MGMEADSKKNTIYHLKVVAYPKQFGKLRPTDVLYSGIFFSLEEAWENGKKHLADKAQAFYDASGYGPKGLSLKEFIDDDQMYYYWTITEYPLDNFNEIEWPKTYNYTLYPHNYIEHIYDFNGEMLCRYYIWDMRSMNARRYIYDGDDLPEAGKKFKVGDFVQLKRPLKSNYDSFDVHDIFVVFGTPRLDEEGHVESNGYGIETVTEKGEYLWHLEFGFSWDGIHESELVKYEGEVPEDSPLMFLRRVFLGEFDGMFIDEYGDRGIVRKLEEGEISLSTCLSWREIPELAALAAEWRK